MVYSRSTYKFYAAIVVLGCLLGGSTEVAAAQLYAVDGAGSGECCPPPSSLTPASLYTVDTSTGVATLVGSTGVEHITAIDFNPTGGLALWVAKCRILLVDRRAGEMP